MLSKSEIISRAINPSQYDLSDVAWEPTEDLGSPIRIFIWEYLKKYTLNWRDKSILDVGAGSGWLVEEARKVGAKEAIGVESSKKNFEASKKLFPLIEMFNVPIEEYVASQKFDVIISILALSHTLDIKKAFDKISSALNTNGEFILIMLDYDYYKIPRFGYEVQTEDLDENTYAVSLKGEHGILADIVRKTSFLISEAEKAHLTYLETIPMKPSEILISSIPLFKEFKEYALFNLIRFKKG